MADSKADIVYGWHFLSADKRLGYGDGREARVGETLSVDVGPELCVGGLHASPTALDALSLGRGPIACRVAVWGNVVGPTDDHQDKIAGQHRQVIAMVDASDLLREFVIDTLRYRQPIIAELFIKAGLEGHANKIAAIDWTMLDDAKRTLDAAWNAARYAARDAARDAAWDAAWDAARDAARYAARNAARNAARYAARYAARDDINTLLERRLYAAMGITARRKTPVHA